jgi:hypothetical protein
MAGSNPPWGDEPIAAELRVKLGLRVSARAGGRYMARETDRGGWGGAAAFCCQEFPRECSNHFTEGLRRPTGR